MNIPTSDVRGSHFLAHLAQHRGLDHLRFISSAFTEIKNKDTLEACRALISPFKENMQELCMEIRSQLAESEKTLPSQLTMDDARAIVARIQNKANQTLDAITPGSIRELKDRLDIEIGRPLHQNHVDAFRLLLEDCAYLSKDDSPKGLAIVCEWAQSLGVLTEGTVPGILALSLPRAHAEITRLVTSYTNPRPFSARSRRNDSAPAPAQHPTNPNNAQSSPAQRPQGVCKVHGVCGHTDAECRVQHPQTSQARNDRGQRRGGQQGNSRSWRREDRGRDRDRSHSRERDQRRPPSPHPHATHHAYQVTVEDSDFSSILDGGTLFGPDETSSSPRDPVRGASPKIDAPPRDEPGMCEICPACMGYKLMSTLVCFACATSQSLLLPVSSASSSSSSSASAPGPPQPRLIPLADTHAAQQLEELRQAQQQQQQQLLQLQLAQQQQQQQVAAFQPSLATPTTQVLLQPPPAPPTAQVLLQPPPALPVAQLAPQPASAPVATVAALPPGLEWATPPARHTFQGQAALDPACTFATPYGAIPSYPLPAVAPQHDGHDLPHTPAIAPREPVRQGRQPGSRRGRAERRRRAQDGRSRAAAEEARRVGDRIAFPPGASVASSSSSSSASPSSRDTRETTRLHPSRQEEWEWGGGYGGRHEVPRLRRSRSRTPPRRRRSRSPSPSAHGRGHYRHDARYRRRTPSPRPRRCVYPPRRMPGGPPPPPPSPRDRVRARSPLRQGHRARGWSPPRDPCPEEHEQSPPPSAPQPSAAPSPAAGVEVRRARRRPWGDCPPPSAPLDTPSPPREPLAAQEENPPLGPDDDEDPPTPPHNPSHPSSTTAEAIAAFAALTASPALDSGEGGVPAGGDTQPAQAPADVPAAEGSTADEVDFFLDALEDEDPKIVNPPRMGPHNTSSKWESWLHGQLASVPLCAFLRVPSNLSSSGLGTQEGEVAAGKPNPFVHTVHCTDTKGKPCEVRTLLDTGSNMTIISPTAAAILGHTVPMSPVKVSLADGSKCSAHHWAPVRISLGADHAVIAAAVFPTLSDVDLIIGSDVLHDATLTRKGAEVCVSLEAAPEHLPSHYPKTVRFARTEDVVGQDPPPPRLPPAPPSLLKGQGQRERRSGSGRSGRRAPPLSRSARRAARRRELQSYHRTPEAALRHPPPNYEATLVSAALSRHGPLEPGQPPIGVPVRWSSPDDSDDSDDEDSQDRPHDPSSPSSSGTTPAASQDSSPTSTGRDTPDSGSPCHDAARGASPVEHVDDSSASSDDESASPSPTEGGLQCMWVGGASPDEQTPAEGLLSDDSEEDDCSPPLPADAPSLAHELYGAMGHGPPSEMVLDETTDDLYAPNLSRDDISRANDPERIDPANVHLKDLAERFPRLFRAELDHKGITLPYATFKVRLRPGATPPYRRPYPLSPVKAQAVNEAVEEMCRCGVAHPADVPIRALAPTHAVPKGKDAWRVVMDYRGLNAVTEDDPRPLPTQECIEQALAGRVLYSQWDMRSAYHQFPCDEESGELMAFATPRGVFIPMRMLFGLKNASAHCQRVMDTLFADVPEVSTFQDDLVAATGRASELRPMEIEVREHQRVVDLVSCRLQKANIILRLDKTFLFVRIVTFCGVRYGDFGSAPSDDHTRAVRDFPVPTSRKELRSFLGLANFVRRFIRGFAGIAAPLHPLTSDLNPFVWEPVHQEAFDGLRQAIVSADALAAPDPSNGYVMETDASDLAVGAVLLQEVVAPTHPPSQSTRPVLKPVGYFSKALSPSERRWSVTEREIFAVVASVHHFRHFIDNGHTTIVHTDHRPSTTVLSAAQTARSPAKLARWAIALSQYKIITVYKPGKENGAADALSRIPPGRPSLPRSGSSSAIRAMAVQIATASPRDGRDLYDWDELWEAQAARKIPVAVIPKDRKTMLRLLPVLSRGPKGEKLHKGRVIPSPDTRRDLVSATHQTGHFSAQTLCSMLSEDYYWERMIETCKEVVRSCVGCIRGSDAAGMRAPLAVRNFRPNASTIFGELALDYVGPLPMTARGYTGVVVFSDCLSRWPEAYPVRSKSAEEMAACLFDIICRFGPPDRLHSDLGKEFVNRLIDSLLERLEALHSTTSGYRPTANGRNEKLNHSLIQTIRRFVHDQPAEWDVYVPSALYAYRVTPHCTTGVSPMQALIGEARPLWKWLAEDVESPRPPQDLAKLVEERAKEMRELTEVLRPALLARSNAASAARARSGPTSSPYEKGQLVTVLNMRPKAKLEPKVSGVYEVLGLTDVGMYNLRTISGPPQPRPVHPSRLRAIERAAAESLIAPASSLPASEEDVYEVEAILDHTESPIHGAQYLVKWAGYPASEATWEPEASLSASAGEVLTEYIRAMQARIDAAAPPEPSPPAVAAPARRRASRRPRKRFSKV